LNEPDAAIVVAAITMKATENLPALAVGLIAASQDFGKEESRGMVSAEAGSEALAAVGNVCSTQAM
jgi:hypothetical protein